jgi:hypothetical protein
MAITDQQRRDGEGEHQSERNRRAEHDLPRRGLRREVGRRRYGLLGGIYRRINVDGRANIIDGCANIVDPASGATR